MFQLCQCIYEPRGSNGLEGYNRDYYYLCEYKDKDKNGRPYYRVYPEYRPDDIYYETCGTGTFKKFFKIVESIPEMDENESVIEWLKRTEKECQRMNEIYYNLAVEIVKKS